MTDTVRLKAHECTYANGFPANLDRSETFVVQIPSMKLQGTVLFTCNITGKQASCGLPVSLSTRYTQGLYVFRGE